MASSPTMCVCVCNLSKKEKKRKEKSVLELLSADDFSI